MLMVCPNCQSKDIVELQGQHFCINCGRLIELLTKKRGPGRPKADRLDKPKPVTMQVAGKAITSSIDAPVASDAEAESESDVEGTNDGIETQIGISVKSKAETDSSSDSTEEEEIESEPVKSEPKITHGFKQPSSPPPPAEVAKQAEVKARKVLQDIVPAGKDDKADDGEAAPESVAAKKRLNLTNIVSAAWSEPWQGGPARILALAAVIAAAVAGSVTYFAFTSQIKQVFPEQVVGLGLIAVAVAFMFGIANTERAATALRRYDHRPIPRSWLFGGALKVLGWQSAVLLAGVAGLAVVIGLGYASGRYVPDMIDQPYGAVGLLASFITLAIILLAGWVATGLGAAGVELGQMNWGEATAFGWSSLRRHPELIGTRLVAALWLAASLGGIVAIGWLLHLSVPEYDQWNVPAAAAILAFTAVLLGNFGAVGWRQAAYRELVILDSPNDAIGLLAGHHNGAPKPIAKYGFVLSVVALFSLGIAAIVSSFYR